MRSWCLSLPLACVLAQAASAQVQANVPVQVQIQPAQADVMLARPGYMLPTNRLTQTDAVVVGRVVALEPMDVDASAAPGQPNVKYRVAVVQLSEALHGVKKDTQMIRVAFLPQGNGNVPLPPGAGIQVLPAVQPGFQPFRGGRPYMPNITLDVGQDGIFMLNKHHKENFYLVAGYNGFITRQNNPNFDSEVKAAKQISKVMADPVASLKSEDRTERYTAAAVLITKYRQPANPQGKPLKATKIDAAESKLILKALAEANWNGGQPSPGIPGPMELFNQMGITTNDGYMPAKQPTQQNITQAMQKFLSENGEKYVIQKLVPNENAKAPAIQPPVKGRLPVQVQPLPAPAPGGVQILPAPGRIQLQPAPAPVPAPEKR